MKHTPGKTEAAARRLIVSPSKILPPYKGEGFWKGVRGWAEIGYNLLVHNSVYQSDNFFQDLMPDINYEDLTIPVAVVFVTSGQQAVLAVTSKTHPAFDIPEGAPEVVVEYKGKVSDLARASSSIPLLFSRHPITINEITAYPTDGAVYRGLPCQFIKGQYRLALSTHSPPTEELKQVRPDFTGWWGIGVPYQLYTSVTTMLAGVTATDISGFMIRGDGDSGTHELSHVLSCGDFRKENNVEVSWLNIGGHTPEVVEQMFTFGVEEAQRFWDSIPQHQKGIRDKGIAVCMTGGGGDGMAQAGFMARLRDLIGKPYIAVSGLSAGAINAIYFSWLEEKIKE